MRKMVGRRERSDTKALEWFLTFLYLDVDSLSRGESIDLVTELDMVLQGWPPDPDYAALLGHVMERWPKEVTTAGLRFPPDRVELKRLQKSLKDFFDKDVKQLTRLSSCENVRLTEDKFKGVQTFVRLHTKVSVAAKVVADVKSEPEEDRVKTRLWQEGAREDALIKVEISCKRHEESLIYQFLQALDLTPLQAIGECPECQRWFLHTSERRKLYCSKQCAQRKASRDMYWRRGEKKSEKVEEKVEETLIKALDPARESQELKVGKEPGGMRKLIIGLPKSDKKKA